MTSLKLALKKACGCEIQHDGWPCGTCFFSISQELNNSDWQNVLLIRGDYKKKELHNLPRNLKESYKKIMRLSKEAAR